MHAADAVFVLRRKILQDRQKASHRGATVSMTYAHQSGGIGDAIREEAALGVEHDARSFAATGGEHHDLAAHFNFGAGLLST